MGERVVTAEEARALRAHYASYGSVKAQRICNLAHTVEVVTAERDRLARLLADVVRGEDPCRFDHHGGCQEHGYLSLEPGERCPMGEAMEAAGAALEALDRGE